MAGKIFFAIVALLILTGGIYYFVSTSGKTTIKKPTTNTEIPQVTQQPGSFTIVYTQEGFTPKDATIQAGSRVMWVNHSGGSAAVNSDDYPDNKKYPMLNLGEFGNNSSVQTTILKPGTYTYYNSLNQDQKGTLTVQ